MDMKQTLIRYRTKSTAADENERLVRDVFRELHAKSVPGVRYAVLRLGDEFFHIVAGDPGTNPMLNLDAFKAFQEGVKARCEELPRRGDAKVVGNYHLLADATWSSHEQAAIGRT
jgi:hypothetical protein